MRRALVLALCACGADATREFPAPGELPIVEEPPDPFVTFDGRAITSAGEWTTIRKPELARLFGYYVYGFAPDVPANTTATEVARATLASGVQYRELEVTYGPAGTPPIYLALFEPATPSETRPVFLVLNACGNQTVTSAPEVRVSDAWVEATCDKARGSHADKFPVEAVVARGAVFATFHQSDVAPDDVLDKEHANGIFTHFSVDGEPGTEWGTIAAWSFGMSRAIDALQNDPGVDPHRIATVGHSRRGKVALLTAALDDRVAIAFPHQSGTAGATMTRADLGEPVFSINLVFPHWFAPHYKAFGDEERTLPVDQHLLLGMVAPRPVLVTNGASDDWADPPGAKWSVEMASPIYDLLGVPGALADGTGGFDFGGNLAWHVRDGGHSLEHRDWDTFLAFAARHGFIAP